MDLLNTKWFLRNTKSHSLNFIVVFRWNGVLDLNLPLNRRNSGQSAKWLQNGNKVTITFSNPKLEYSGIINEDGNSFSGLAVEHTGGKIEFKGQFIEKILNANALSREILNGRWHLMMSKDFEFKNMESRKTERIAKFLTGEKLDFRDLDGKEIGRSNLWFHNIYGGFTIKVNDGFANYEGKLLHNGTIDGTARNTKGAKWFFKGEKIVEKLGEDDNEKTIFVEEPAIPTDSKVFAQDEFCDDTQISSLGNYHKYWEVYKEVVNPGFDEFSRKILRLKEGEGDAMAFFLKKLNAILAGEGFVICYVPSSDKDKISTGIRTLCKKLATSDGRIDGTGCVVRHKTVPKAAHGGRRSIDVHINSLKIVDHVLIKDKIILLLDDVTTTGSSLQATKRLLINAGAKKVYCFALAQTN